MSDGVVPSACATCHKTFDKCTCIDPLGQRRQATKADEMQLGKQRAELARIMRKAWYHADGRTLLSYIEAVERWAKRWCKEERDD